MTMKSLTRLTAVSALLAATALASGAFAGQEPYVATVCDDRSAVIESSVAPNGIQDGYCNNFRSYDIGVRLGAFKNFYMSAKEYQFTHTNFDNAYRPVPTLATFAKGENFLIVLPKKPEGNLNLAIQCGVFKPEETDVMFCAGEEGEIQGPGRCNQALTLPGVSNIVSAGLPMITATAYPGLYTRQFNNYTPFRLTAYRTPSTMAAAFDANGALTNSAVNQVLNGSAGTRMPLKACLTETIFIKQPVTGQVNALGQTESDLESGDYIIVRMDVPRGHTMDLYCHAQSVKIQGIGDPLSLLD
ncbi:MAG: hypothetical protein MUE49_10750 [Rhodospirillales bacterium]|nr:hypothetical protein [Rhodospirillales bacterium]